MIVIRYRETTNASIMRALTAAALRYDGLLLREIGEHLGGITHESARKAVIKGENILRRRYAAINECAELIARGAPVETRNP